MPDFGDPKKALSEFAKNLQQKAGIVDPNPVEPAANIPGASAPPAQPTGTEPANPTVPVQQTPVAPVEPPAPDPKAVSTTPDPVIDEVEDWDKDIAPAAPVTGPLTIEEISSALKLDGVKSKDDLVAQFTKREARIQELETAQQQQFTDIPEELRDVLEVTRKGGDWRAYLGMKVIDYSKADPIKLFEQDVDNFYRRPDGSIDQAAADLALSQVPEAVQRSQGEAIKRTLMMEQQQKRQQLANAAEQRRNEFNRGLAEAARNINKSLTKEVIGVTLEPKHSDFLYEGIRNGSLIKKHLGTTDVSGIEPGKLVRTIAIAEWGEKFAAHQHKQGITAGRKQMLADKQNVQLNTPSIPVNPSQQGDKPKTAAEKLRERFQPAGDGRPHL